jgi:hypothetical protein
LGHLLRITPASGAVDKIDRQKPGNGDQCALLQAFFEERARSRQIKNPAKPAGFLGNQND